jgi:hypothetical protein
VDAHIFDLVKDPMGTHRIFKSIENCGVRGRQVRWLRGAFDSSRMATGAFTSSVPSEVLPEILSLKSRLLVN